MKKRILAILMTALLAVSVAACNNGGGSDTSSKSESSVTESKTESKESKDESKAEKEEESKKTDESSAESKAEQSSKASEESKEQTSVSVISGDELGEKTKAAFTVIQGEEFTMSLSIAVDGGSGSTSDDDSLGGMMALMAGGGIKMDTVKAKDGRSRTIMDLSVSKIDMLSLPEGSYVIDNTNKIAYFTKAEEQTAPLIDTESMTDIVSPEGMELIGQGTEDFQGKSCSFEQYKIKPVTKQLAVVSGEESNASSTEKESEMKFYFDGDKPVGIVIKSDDKSVTVTINTLSATADESMLKVPDGYEVKDDDGTGVLSAFGALMGMMQTEESGSAAPSVQ